VGSLKAAKAAERDAWCLLGVNDVENRLIVETGETAG
jgi:hypothetical protein